MTRRNKLEVTPETLPAVAAHVHAKLYDADARALLDALTRELETAWADAARLRARARRSPSSRARAKLLGEAERSILDAVGLAARARPGVVAFQSLGPLAKAVGLKREHARVVVLRLQRMGLVQYYCAGSGYSATVRLTEAGAELVGV